MKYIACSQNWVTEIAKNTNATFFLVGGIIMFVVLWETAILVFYHSLKWAQASQKNLRLLLSVLNINLLLVKLSWQQKRGSFLLFFTSLRIVEKFNFPLPYLILLQNNKHWTKDVDRIDGARKRYSKVSWCWKEMWGSEICKFTLCYLLNESVLHF